MKVKEFSKIIKNDVDEFEKNMNNLNERNCTYLEWFQLFKNWSEIDTYMEEQYYPNGNPVDYEENVE